MDWVSGFGFYEPDDVVDELEVLAVHLSGVGLGVKGFRYRVLGIGYWV
jgi:hypothetical protein